MKKFKKFNQMYGVNFVNKYWIWISIPVAIFVVAMIFFGIFAGINKDAGKGANVGIDFAGGSVVTIILGEEQLTGDKYDENQKKIEDIILSEEIAQAIVDYSITQKINENIQINNTRASISYVQKSDSGESMSIIFKYDNISKSYDKDNVLTTQRNKLVQDRLADIFSEENGYADVAIEMSNIGASASQSLINSALIATSITFLLILIYIIFRFEIWSGIAAILALLSDITIMVSLTVIFRIQINSSFIAALITIVAYSINNTIVVFDRVRENMKNETALVGSGGKIDTNRIVNNSIWDTMLRSINSTITTLVPIILFAILGAAAIEEFALPVIFGLLAGFFSSLCLAPSLYCLMKNAAEKKKALKSGVVKYVGQK